MFELFTERAKKVVVLAQEEAIDIGYRSVGTEDFLLGLLREGTGWFQKPGLAAKVLKSTGLSLQNARRAAKQFRRPDKGAGSVEFQSSGDTYVKVTHTEFTEHANQLQLAAKDCARELGHKQIDTAHLLIGLLSLDDCNGVKVLKNLKVDCDRLRETATNLLNSRRDSD
jgi:ATP-dependent Clp protease ATP-binding subunit ClpC